LVLINARKTGHDAHAERSAVPPIPSGGQLMWSPFNGSQTLRKDHPDDVGKHVLDAYALLCNANRRGIQVPSDVVSTITQARAAAHAGTLEGVLETRFWKAYGLLSSSIEPAERARRTYKLTFYGVLVALLLGQFFYLGGASVRDKMTELDKQIIEVKGKAAEAAEKSPAATSTKTMVAELQTLLEKRQKAYLSIAQKMLQAVDGLVYLPLRPFGFHGFFYTEADPTSELETTIIRSKLEMLLLFFSGYLLPMLYGLIGACAFVLRKLSDEIDKMTYAHDARVRYTLRLNIGVLTGLAVGWFLTPGAGDPLLTSLSPLALAFVAGYGSDLFFLCLDKIVQAFAPVGGAPTMTPLDTTSGGLTIIKESAVAAHIAGNGFSEAAAIHVPETPFTSSTPRANQAPAPTDEEPQQHIRIVAG
jgi:hypothetical protein